MSLCLLCVFVLYIMSVCLSVCLSVSLFLNTHVSLPSGLLLSCSVQCVSWDGSTLTPTSLCGRHTWVRSRTHTHKLMHTQMCTHAPVCVLHATDVCTQANYQLMDPHFIGMIVSCFNLEGNHVSCGLLVTYCETQYTQECAHLCENVHILAEAKDSNSLFPIISE